MSPSDSYGASKMSSAKLAATTSSVIMARMTTPFRTTGLGPQISPPMLIKPTDVGALLLRILVETVFH